MKFKSLVVLICAIFLLGGCGSKSGLSKEDIGIRKIDDPKAKVEYGMSREDAEKILGAGKRQMKFLYTYQDGVTIYYRDDVVAGVGIAEEAKARYETAGGARIGMLNSEFQEIYGDQVASSKDGSHLLYYYDSDKKLFSTDEEPPKKATEEEARSIFTIYARTDDRGYVETITLCDLPIAQLGR